MRILLAEDTGTTRRIIAGALKQWGYDVVVCCDGTEAWDRLKQPGAPRLAVLDWMMPGMSGPAISERLRASEGASYTYIILLTARDAAQDVVAGLEAGADDYVTKPVNRQELRQRVRAGARIVELQGELMAAHDALQHQATHDLLTGLWNRKGALDALERELARCASERGELSILFADINRFRQVNDTLGHGVGDAVLRNVADALLQSVRPYDIVSRYHGDEFLCVLPQTSADAAVTLAEKLGPACEARAIKATGGTLRLAISIGVARGDQDSTSEGLIRQARDGLDQAKAFGSRRPVLGAIPPHRATVPPPDDPGATQPSNTSEQGPLESADVPHIN